MTTKTTARPPLSDARIAEIENAVFAGIAHERDRERAERARRSARRGRLWGGGLAAAGLLVVAAVIGPSLLTPSGAGISTADMASVPVSSEFTLMRESAVEEGALSIADADASVPIGGDREVIATASATVEVDDLAAAASTIEATATAEGGFVESMSLGRSGTSFDPGQYGGDIAYYPASDAWISVRVPADRLDAVTSSLSEVGTVTSSRIDRQDVTTQAIDLRARVGALEASVERLTSLMAEATTTADLLTAEGELAARQAELDSYRQQLSYLDGQVQLSTLTVSLVEPAPVVTADPAGFGDGVTAGWNGLIETLNGIVIGLGFLLPWLGVLAVVVLAVWAIRRLLRARRAARAARLTEAAENPTE